MSQNQHRQICFVDSDVITSLGDRLAQLYDAHARLLDQFDTLPRRERYAAIYALRTELSYVIRQLGVGLPLVSERERGRQILGITTSPDPHVFGGEL